MPEDFSSDTIKSYDYFYIGDRVLFEGRSLQIKTVDAVLTDGILECTYSMGLKTSFQAAPITNSHASGRMMTGTVTAVMADKVQVFKSVDSQEDSSSNGGFLILPPIPRQTEAGGIPCRQWEMKSGYFSLPETKQMRLLPVLWQKMCGRKLRINAGAD
ncbi:MAG: hypothetical protein ACLT46_13750 [Hungatella sp.]